MQTGEKLKQSVDFGILTSNRLTVLRHLNQSSWIQMQIPNHLTTSPTIDTLIEKFRLTSEPV